MPAEALPPLAIFERAALSAIPAPRVAFDGPFIIRAFHGGTGRANAVSALDPAPDPELATRLDRLEARFERLGLPLRFRSTPLDPANLAAELDARGYARKDETIILAGPLAPIAEASPQVTAHPAPTDDWMALVGTAEYQTEARRAEKREGAPLLLTEGAWLVLRVGGQPAACAAIVADGVLAGAFDLAVSPDFRRQGLARNILRAGAAWAAARGARFLYAQVAAANAASQATCRGLGLAEAYRYVYRVKPGAVLPAMSFAR